MSLLNRKETRRFILQQAKAIRPGWECSRVSGKAIDELESWFRYKLTKLIHMHPSNGKTFREIQL